jgi:diguanylate cyclase (GGDEF)-like protein/PAS domain S-box-containing protein
VAHAAESQPPDAGTPGFEAFRLAYEAAPVGVAIGDPLGQAVYVNERMAAILGRPRDHVDIGTFVEAAHADDRLQVRGRMQAVARGDLDAYVVETRFVHADASVVWARVHVRAQRDDQGTLVLLLAHAEDITEQKRAEAALRESEARTAALLRHTREVVMIIGRAGAIRYASPAVEEVLGYEPDAFTSLHPFELLHPDDRAAWVEGWRQVTHHAGARFALSTRVLHADGRYRWCEATLRDLAGEAGVDGYLAHFRDVTEQRRSEDDLATRALHDALTGLANRALLVDRLQHALDRAQRSGAVVALLFCDLDRFKRVNDTFGHAVGDVVLREVAARLRAVVRPADTVARLGGDEFVVCCEDVGASAEAVVLAERILAALGAPYAVDGQELSLSASVGIAIAGRGTDGPDDVLRSADAAMYTAKGNGRGRYEVFDDDIRVRLRRRLDTEREVRRALAGAELRLHFQPIFRIPETLAAARTLAGVEALVRWQHPERGMLEPADFLAVAERSGAATRILEWVLDAACRQSRAWRRAGHPVPPVWVNLSHAQLTQSRVGAVVGSALTAHDLPAAALGFDVAEATVQQLERTPGAAEGLEALADLGCALAIDDFGTASTSLRSVHRFGIDVLKIDESLWREPDPARLLGSAVSFGEMLGLTVTAEGVETTDQLDLLRASGCHWASGYLLAAPGPAADVEARLA